MKKISMIGRVFGRLTVIGYSHVSKGHYYWECVCECGETEIADGGHLRVGNIVSCGCFKDERIAARSRTHGQTGSKEHKAWSGMIQRCTNPKEKCWRNYGGRGISVCRRWRSFQNFLSDMGKCPNGMTLDRFPNLNGNYEPGNCRWATVTQQANNTRANRRIIAFGEIKTAKEWSRDPRCAVKYATLAWRAGQKCWSGEDAITYPASFWAYKNRKVQV
jgi:hypothetical protein